MINDEARAHLVELGARVAKAKVEYYEAMKAVVIAHESELAEVFDIAEQESCFYESCTQAGVDAEHRAFKRERQIFEAARASDDGFNEMLDRLGNAPLN